MSHARAMDAAAADDDDAASSSSSSSSCNGGDPPDGSAFSSDIGAPPSVPSSPDSSSSSSSSELLDRKGPLFEMSPLMYQLPVKRGLSVFYEGKSQSFTCLGDARCVEDLAKGERTPDGKRMKKKTRESCYDLDAMIKQRPSFVPGTFFSWSKSERNKSSSALLARRRRRRRRSGGGSLFSSSDPPPVPLHRNLP